MFKRTYLGALCFISAVSSAAPSSTDPLAAVDLNRNAIIADIVSSFEAGQDVYGGSAAMLKGRLEKLRADRLLAASLASSRESLELILAEAEKANKTSAYGVPTKSLGDTNRDLVYTPLSPCRMIDTRGFGAPIQGGAFAPNERRAYVPTGRCGIPTSGVASLLLSFTTQNLTPNSGGYLAILGPGMPVTATVDVFNFGAEWSASNTAVGTGTAGQFDVYVSTANAHVVIDVLGYYASVPATAGTDFVPPQIDVTAPTVASTYRTTLSILYSDNVELGYYKPCDQKASFIEVFDKGAKQVQLSSTVPVPLGDKFTNTCVATDTSGNLAKQNVVIASPPVGVTFGAYSVVGTPNIPADFSCFSNYPVFPYVPNTIRLSVGPFVVTEPSNWYNVPSAYDMSNWTLADGYRVSVSIYYQVGNATYSPQVSTYSASLVPLTATTALLDATTNSQCCNPQVVLGYAGELRVVQAAPPRIEVDLRMKCNPNNAGWVYGGTARFVAEMP